MTAIEIRQLRSRLLNWFAQSKRDLPWRLTKDAYRIWISEIMLQQTRVAAVIPYYDRFLARFPSVEVLANAPEEDLLAHWAGLGYYSRARNLQKAAQRIAIAGGFPTTYEGICELPGVGDYTAAAVASIAFDLPHVVLDGNVFRVLSRLFNDSMNIKSPHARRHFAKLADELMDPAQPGDFNQAMMELGATVCLPRAPRCLLCPVAEFCRAREAQTQTGLPTRVAAPRNAAEQRTLYWIERDGQLLLWQRPADARLMPGFWELPERDQLPQVEAGEVIGMFRHGITVHDYRFTIVHSTPPQETGACRWVPLSDLNCLPSSTVLRKAWTVVHRTPMGNANVILSVAAAR
ncbi:MAG TPA: A/G-specific adenine glycosylase [Bryobacteraceae bacterium]|jgi:A/G-specific adenine glycosylase|nr:A/G-specific adenine glycosylase [Bryobacteraceae bacterium]